MCTLPLNITWPNILPASGTPAGGRLTGYLCCRKVCTMLPLMMLSASHTSMATMFLARALAKLSLGTAAAPPVSTELQLLVCRSRRPEEVALSNILLTIWSKGAQTRKSGVCFREVFYDDDEILNIRRFTTRCIVFIRTRDTCSIRNKDQLENIFYINQ